MKVLVSMAVSWFVGGGIARAQYAAPPTPTGVCVSCSGGTSSTSGSDPQFAAALAAEKAERAQIDRDNAARMNAEQRVHNFRQANHDGVAAYNKKQWASAIRAFEKALAINPDDYHTRSNLAAAEAAQADEQNRLERERVAKRRADELEKYRQAHAAEQKRLSKFLANRPIVPPPGSGPSINVGVRLDDSQPPAIEGSRDFIGNVQQAIGDRAKDEALGHLEGMMDVFVPHGAIFVRTQMNITKLATDVIPKMLMAAAKGEIEPGAALTEYAVTVIYNVDNITDRTTELATSGINSLVIGLGAKASGAGARFEADARALIDEIERARPIVERWIAQPEGAK
jgi:tetratricopeptide (TPR) repeat protein